MTNYLFINVNRYDASQSIISHFRSNMLPELAFRFAYLENWGEGDEEAENYYEEEIKRNVVVGREMITYDGEENTFLLIPLKK